MQREPLNEGQAEHGPLLFIKAALESVDRGIVTVEQAFMAFLVTGDGETLGDKALPAYVQHITEQRRAIEAYA